MDVWRDVLLPSDKEAVLERSSVMCTIFGAMSLAIVVSVSIIPAPYGRLARPRFGIYIPALPAWMIQECPALFMPLLLMYLQRDSIFSYSSANLLLMAVFIIHYFNRAIIYPLVTCTSSSKPATLTSFLCAIYFCLHNGYMQSFYLLAMDNYPEDWTSSFQFLFGMSLWLIGFLTNIHCDHILRNLRAPGEVGYKLPKGGLFEYVSAANYGSECIEWLGFAIAACNPAATVFCSAVFANLVPRGLLYHKMYKEKFEDYPKSRKAVIPFLL